MEPSMRLLKIVDGDQKSSSEYIYERMRRARKGIKSLFKKKKSLYKSYTQIIKSRWDRQLRKDIHAAAYYVNPVFQYDKTSFCEKPEVMNGMLKMLSSKGTGSKAKLVNEMRLFRERLESFGQELAFETCRNTLSADYESIDKTNFWVVDDENEPFLDYEDIENMLYEQLDPPRMESDCRRPREGLYVNYVEIIIKIMNFHQLTNISL